MLDRGQALGSGKTRDMNDQRQVLVRAESRHVVVSDLDGDPETLTYPGVTLTRVNAGIPDEGLWLPMGDRPSEVDDETLIEALRAAFLWRIGSPRRSRPEE
ncbi:hypothetical protein ACWEGE_40680 [Amycolatopsis sp. NPDC004747]